MPEEPERKDKAEDSIKKLKGRKPPEYKAFEEMLKKIVKSPPMRRTKTGPL